MSGNWFSLSCHLLLNHFKHDARAQVFDAVRWWIILWTTECDMHRGVADGDAHGQNDVVGLPP